MNPIKHKVTPKCGQATALSRNLKPENNKETENLLAPVEKLINHVRQLDIKLKESQELIKLLNTQIEIETVRNQELNQELDLGSCRNMDIELKLLDRDNQIHNLKIEIDHLKQGFRSIKDVIKKTPYANEPTQGWGSEDQW